MAIRYLGLVFVLAIILVSVAQATPPELNCKFIEEVPDLSRQTLYKLWVKSGFKDLVIVDNFIYTCPCFNSARIGGTGDQARIGGAGDQARIGGTGDQARVGGAIGCITCQIVTNSPLGYTVRSISKSEILIFNGSAITIP